MRTVCILCVFGFISLTIPSFSQNDAAPVITGQTPNPLTTPENTPITITLDNLIVTDADPEPVYPAGFSLELNSGDNYEFSGATVTPDEGFSGMLTVRVRVDDGENNSDWFDLALSVIPAPNVAPQITEQVPISIDQGQSVTLALTQLTVNDPDNEYPNDFTLTVYDGTNYTVSGATVTPAAIFFGNLTVEVSVNDGEAESPRFPLIIQVAEVSNAVPQITGQTALTIDQGENLTITLANLTVVDPDNSYPADFTLTVYEGTNYTFSGTTITPAATFSGTLTIPVSVNDGTDESNKFNLIVQVRQPDNVAPQITGQVPLSTYQAQTLTITFAHLVVTDPDDSYPTGYTLTVYAGNDYAVVGNSIIPLALFTGKLKVPVSVNDGEDESNRFELTVDVLKAIPLAPLITGQKPISTNEDVPVAIGLTDLTVVDADNTYPDDFTLKLSPGAHYTVSGSTVVPTKDYYGSLSVTARVNDGTNDSPPFALQITVVPINDVPVIRNQKNLSTGQGVPITLVLTDLTVTDPDNTYPDDFILRISPGSNYVATNSTVTPSPTFAGTLNVTVSVSDGKASSADFNLKITVVAANVNVAPVIVAQKAISITQNTSVAIQLGQLVVDDPDNEYPVGFILKVYPGSNYTVSGTTITPAAAFVSGTLSVGVTVNDGTNESALFSLKVQVTPISATPRINGQRELTMMEDSTLTISLSDLIVTDADDSDYPNGFTLKVLNDAEGVYHTSGNTVTPGPDLYGFIDVGVTVSDGVNTSDEFRLVIFVNPVNDAPRITSLETSQLSYEPGTEPVEIFNRLVLADVDNERLSMAEVGFRQFNYSPANDEILFDFDTTLIRPIRDPSGILFLIGYATVSEYQTALRSMKYNYKVTTDLNGQPNEILSGARVIYVNVNDGQDISATSERSVEIAAKITLDIPNAFTPNGDNANDTWRLAVSNDDQLDQAIIRVYNKRGLLIFESDEFGKEWDGTFNGELLPVDTYYYTIVVKLPYVRQTYSGVVTILY